MRIVVSGATGNTGTSVVRALSRAGHHVVAVTRDPDGKVAKELTSLPNVVAKREEDAFDQPADRVYLAFTVSRDQFLNETDFILAARAAGVKYIVKLATVDAWMDANADPFYARTHVAVEHFLAQGPTPFTSLRANLFHAWIGPDLASVPSTKQFRTYLHGSSVATVDPEDVGTAAAALLLLGDPSQHYGKKYMVTGPEDVNDATIATALSEVLGTEVKFGGSLTEEEAKAPLRGLGFSDKAVESVLVGLTFFKAGKGDLKHTKTSPEILALAPPTRTYKDFIARLYGKH